MAKSSKSQGGGRLNRSEIVSIRLDPKLNYLVELAARVQRRSKSSLIEAAIEEYLHQVPLGGVKSKKGSASLGDAGDRLWHIEEGERLVRLATQAPQLMDFNDQRRWAVIEAHRWFWVPLAEGVDAELASYFPGTHLSVLRVLDQWELICRVADGEAPASALPRKGRP